MLRFHHVKQVMVQIAAERAFHCVHAKLPAGRIREPEKSVRNGAGKGGRDRSARDPSRTAQGPKGTAQIPG